MLATLRQLFADGFAAKDIERLRREATSNAERELVAREVDAFLRRSAVTLLPPQRAALWFQVAEAYREAGQTMLALEQLKRVLSEDPTHLAAANTLASLAEPAGLWEDLIFALSLQVGRLRKDTPADFRVGLHRRMANVLHSKLNDPERAFQELMRAVRLQPENDALYQETLLLAERADGFRDLAVVLEDSADRQTEKRQEARFLERLAYLYEHKLHDPTRARDLNQRLKLLPAGDKIVESKWALARALVDLDELRRTESRLRREGLFLELTEAYAQHEAALAAEEHEQRAEVALIAALVFADTLGDLAKAAETTARAISYDPQFTGAHRHMVDLQLKQGHHELAVQACERWAECCPKQATEALLAACDLAWNRLRDRPRAERALASAKALSPNDPRVIVAEKSLQG